MGKRKDSAWAAGAWRSQEPQRVERITVGTAKHIIGPTHEVLIGLSIPNDLSQEHRDLFLELLRRLSDHVARKSALPLAADVLS